VKEYIRTEKFLVLTSIDNVGVALQDLKEGEKVHIKEKEVIIKEKIEFGHKFAIKDIKKGEKIVKFGEIIGEAIKDIFEGQHVHIHNIKSLRARRNE